tara:strand:- start:13304 stop:13903 length:600 start_codon:yes stop_codon:yes gene_type:complete
LSDNKTFYTRRAAIKSAVALLGGTLTAMQLDLLSNSYASSDEALSKRFFTSDQFKIISRIADLIIPETDTPGALGVGAPNFIDMMLTDWASSNRQLDFVKGLDEINLRAKDSLSKSFLACSAEQQELILREIDKEYFNKDLNNLYFGMIKKMVLFAYYSSEVGATLELNFQRIPGDYLPCVPLSENTYASFWSHHNYGL